MGKITCIHGVKVGSCRCMNDWHGGIGKCPPECEEKKMEVSETEPGWPVEAVAEIVELREQIRLLRTALDAENHVAVFDQSGWGLEHSVDCRLAKTLTSCRYNVALDRYCSGGPGTYQQEKLIAGGRWILGFDDTPQRRLTLELESE